MAAAAATPWAATSGRVKDSRDDVFQNLRAKRLAVVALALPVRLGRALVIRLGRLPAHRGRRRTRLFASRRRREGLAAELLGWARRRGRGGVP